MPPNTLPGKHSPEFMPRSPDRTGRAQWCEFCRSIKCVRPHTRDERIKRTVKGLMWENYAYGRGPMPESKDTGRGVEDMLAFIRKSRIPSWRESQIPDGARKDQPMPTETVKCPKCSKAARRTGMTKEGGQLVKHMKCGTCGHRFKVKLSSKK